MEGVRFRGAVTGAVVGAVMIAGCSGGGGQPTAGNTTPSLPPSSPPAASTPSLSPDQLAVVQAYERFWRRLPEASRASSDARRLAMLVPVATDPELSQLITTMHREQQKREVLYGDHIAHVQGVTVDNQRAELNDCQDASSAGVATRSGRKLTVGVKRNPVVATLLLRGGVWKVSVIRYPKGASC